MNTQPDVYDDLPAAGHSFVLRWLIGVIERNGAATTADLEAAAAAAHRVHGGRTEPVRA